MNIIISGGCGFVGSNLAITLKGQYPNANIQAFDNLKRRGSELNIKRLKTIGVDFVHGDMRCKEDLEVFTSCDLFIDASAEPSVLAGIDSGHRQLIENNLTSTINALDFCLRKKAKFIFLSTSRVYPVETLETAKFEELETRFVWTKKQSIEGISEKGVQENLSMRGAKSLYGATKYASEVLIEEYVSFLGLKAIINRCGVLAGPWQMGKIDQGVLVLWLARHHFKQQLAYIGYDGLGKQLRDMLHIEDFCKLIVSQIENWDLGNGKVFNVGGGISSSSSLLELTNYCEEVTGNTLKINKAGFSRPADLRIYVTDNSLVSQTFNWHPEKTIRDLVKDTYNWLVENESSLIEFLK